MAEQQGDSSDQSNLLSLKWNNHLSNFKVIIASLQEKSILSDATLACDGQLFPVHKLVLSTCSEFFGRVFSSTPCKHPVVVLHDLQPQHLHYLLSYMYVGEVNVPQAHLPTLIRAAETLQIKGLAAPDEEPPPVPGASETRLTDNQVRKDYYSTNQNTGRELFNKSANSNRSPAKRRRCFSVDDDRNDCDNQSKSCGDNIDHNFGKRQNKLDVKRSRKSDTGLESEYNNKDNDETSSFSTDVKQEKISKSSSLEQDGSIKEENDISGSDDITSLEQEMGGWADEQGPVNWTSSSSQNEASPTALPWMPFSSPSSLSARDSEASPNNTSNYSAQFESGAVDLPQHTLASDQEGYTPLPLQPPDYDGRGAGRNSVRPTSRGAQATQDVGDTNSGGGVRVGAVTSNTCITSDPQLLSVVGRLLPCVSSCSNEGAGDFSAQDVINHRSRNMSGSSIGYSKSINSASAARRQSLAYTGTNSIPDVNNLLNSDTSFLGSDPNALSSEIFSSIIGITGGATTKAGVGGVVSTSCGLLHECPVCPKTFQSRADVVRHLRTHTGERPYKCPHCHYRAALKGNLKSHILSRHTPDKGVVGALLSATTLLPK